MEDKCSNDQPTHEAASSRLSSAGALDGLHPSLVDPVEYRKSGLSLNHVIGCPIDCAYCVRHVFDNFSMKQPQALMSDEDAVAYLLSHPYFVAHRTPVQLFNRATDPFLPQVKPHTFRVLGLLGDRELTNHVLVITRFRVSEEDAKRLNSFSPLRVTLLVTHSGIDDARLEPVDSEIAERSLITAHGLARSYKVILYWRPMVGGLNDSPAHVRKAARLSHHAHATAFTGLFHRDQMRAFYRQNGLAEPYGEAARRKVLPGELESKVIDGFASAGGRYLFRKTSCAVAFAHGEPDYNGHYGVREICDICPSSQLGRCASDWATPSAEEVTRVAKDVGAPQFETIDKRAITFAELDEQRRYYIQHALRYQVHDARHPHHAGRHGRADLGWEERTSG